MAIKIEGDMNALALMIKRDGDKAIKAALDVMDEKADLIVSKAADNAPVDRHNLERAIYRDPERKPDSNRKRRNPLTGQFMGYEITIGVLSVISDKETGELVNIDQYAVIMHESDRAGKGSPENDKKRAEGKNPGPKYLERAWKEVDPDVEPEMIAAVLRAI